MTDDIDIYRSAKLYIDQYGDQAVLQAAMRSDELLAHRRHGRRKGVAKDHQAD